MILSSKEFKETCSKILIAISKSDLDDLTGSLELKVEDSNLVLITTNGEYYVTTKFALPEDIVLAFSDFHATVNASKFLKLVSQLTTEEIELNAKDKYLEIKANGKYKVPFIFEGENLVTLPVIKIDNVTSSFDISNDILNSITIYNSKNIKKI